jgi:hypothetical protein
MIRFAVKVQADHEDVKKLIDLSQSSQRPQRKIKKLCDLCGLCEITRKCLQLSKFLMTEIRTNPGNLTLDISFKIQDTTVKNCRLKIC